ncbi:DUF2877 domain-containing protein [Nocardioides alpinus]|uniref:DUF2877 domain-containing protein n=1 Tax=Nocardioides alpinus TaxID=748909 RepID=A0ABX4QVR9_9ACTN|nr:DUF2877 domain-containing protein [Nocardioides alpinus]
MSRPIQVAAPTRVRERLAAATDGPRQVLHASASAIYIDLDGWCLGLVSASATRVPCALWSTIPDLTDLGRAAVRVESGALHLGHEQVRITRLADVSAPALAVHGNRGSERARCMTSSAGLVLPADGRLTVAHLDRLLGRGPGLTPLGDDVLAGWFAARLAAGRPDHVLAAAVRRRLALTTLLSATLLDCALRGEVLPELGAWLAEPDDTTAEALLAVGATSGAGMLAGAGLALTSITDRDHPGRAA